jgi:hypothetical protein
MTNLKAKINYLEYDALYNPIFNIGEEELNTINKTHNNTCFGSNWIAHIQEQLKLILILKMVERSYFLKKT